MLDVRPLDTSPAGIEETCELLQAVYPHAHHITTDYLNRLYNGNPLGPTFGFSAFEAGTLVGHYLMIPLVTKIHGVEEQGIWPFQLATRPGFRGKGLFSALVEQSFDAARERGYGHLVGVANDMSTPIFVRKWDFLNIRPLDVKLGFGPIPDREGDSEEAGLQLERVWDSPGIGWRLGHPAAPYRMRRRGRTRDCSTSQRMESGRRLPALITRNCPRRCRTTSPLIHFACGLGATRVAIGLAGRTLIFRIGFGPRL